MQACSTFSGVQQVTRHRMTRQRGRIPSEIVQLGTGRAESAGVSDAEPPRAVQARQEALPINCACIERIGAQLGSWRAESATASNTEPLRTAEASPQLLPIDYAGIERMACILGLDERNRPMYQILSLHVLFKPARRRC